MTIFDHFFKKQDDVNLSDLLAHVEEYGYDGDGPSDVGEPFEGYSVEEVDDEDDRGDHSNR